MAARLSFEYMKTYCAKMKDGKKVPRLARTPEMQTRYEAHTKKHPNMREYVMATYLSIGDKCLVRNKFPLHLEPNVSQYVMWFKKTHTLVDVERMVQDAFAPKRTALFENPLTYKSIPDLYHVHIFVEDFRHRL